MRVQATTEAARLRGEVAAARADNVALVERLRFVQGFAQQQRGRKGAYTAFTPFQRLLKVDQKALLALGNFGALHIQGNGLG